MLNNDELNIHEPKTKIIEVFKECGNYRDSGRQGLSSLGDNKAKLFQI